MIKSTKTITAALSTDKSERTICSPNEWSSNENIGKQKINLNRKKKSKIIYHRSMSRKS